MRHAALIAAAALLAACATAPAGAPPPSAGPTIPAGELDLGDWRNATEAATLAHFQSVASRRYVAGVTLGAVVADLRGNGFSCGPPAPSDGRGDPPAQVCRNAVTASGCTHTWHVLLYGADTLTRSRALYDRRCGNEGLLGGPG